MKIVRAGFGIIFVFLLGGISEAEEAAASLGPDMNGWEMSSAPEAKSALDVVPDGYDGQPSLRLVVEDVPPEKWWMVSIRSPKFSVEEGVFYVLTFWAKTEELPKSIFLSIGADGKKISREQKLAIQTGWEEYRFYFSVDRTAIAHLTVGNLGQQGLSLQLAAPRLERE